MIPPPARRSCGDRRSRSYRDRRFRPCRKVEFPTNHARPPPSLLPILPLAGACEPAGASLPTLPFNFQLSIEDPDLSRVRRFRPGRNCQPPLRRSSTDHESLPLLHCPPMARQRLGQHFLADLHWREEIARAIRVSPHSIAPLGDDERSLRVPIHRDHHCWIEIGAGHGEITQHLLATGASVHAIEIDPAFIAGLRHLAQKFPNLTVVPADVLETDIAAIASGRRIRIYGNLPYYISSPILHHLFNFADLIDEIHIVVQTEVAHRLATQPGTRDYGYLSVVTQFYARPEFVFEIPRDAFNPLPEVTSALVTLRLPGERAELSLGDPSRFLDFVKLCFSKKRKTLVNNLRSLAKPERVREVFAALSLRADARAEQLSVSQLAALHARLAGA